MGSLKKWPQHVDSIFKHFRSDYSMQWQKNACNTQLNKQWQYLICEEMIASFGFHIPQWLFTAIKIPARHNNNRRKHRNVRKNISYGKFRFEISSSFVPQSTIAIGLLKQVSDFQNRVESGYKNIKQTTDVYDVQICQGTASRKIFHKAWVMERSIILCWLRDEMPYLPTSHFHVGCLYVRMFLRIETKAYVSTGQGNSHQDLPPVPCLQIKTTE